MKHSDLMIGYAGELVRMSSLETIRTNFSRHHNTINSLADLKATLRAGRYTSVGSYPLFFITSDGACLTFQTVRDEWSNIVGAHLNNDRSSGWHIAACDVHYEGELHDDHTGELIESAYG